jgi:hypothetical protein
MQAIVLSGDSVDEQVFYRDPEPFWPRREIFQFGHHRADIAQIEIRIRGKGPESCPDALYAVAESVARQADHLTGPLTGSSKEDAAGFGLRRDFGSGEMVTVATRIASS